MGRTQRYGTYNAKWGVDYGYLEADSTWTGLHSPSAGALDVYASGTKTMSYGAGVTANLLDLVGTTLTTGKALDISDLAAITTGKAIHVDATGVTQTTGILVHIDSASTALTGAGRLLLVDATGDFNDATGIVAELKSVHTTGIGLQLTMDAITDGFGVDGTFDALTTGEAFRLTSSATAITGAGRLLNIDHTGATSTSGILSEFSSAATDETTILRVTASGALAAGVGLDMSLNAMTTGTGIDMGAMDAITTGKGINVQSTGEAVTSGILLDVGHTGSGLNADMTGNVARFTSSITDTDTSGTATENYDTVLISRTDVMNGAGGTLDADGALLKLESTATQTAGTLTHDVIAVEIATNSRSASDTYAIKITHDNAGSGAAGGIDLSSFAAGEPSINFVEGNASAIDPSATAETGWINIAVGGTIRYIPYYAAS